MYWNQTAVYHLRQASATTKEAEVIKAIRHTSEHYHIRYYSDLPDAGKALVKAKMARVLTINVLDAFHKSRPPSMPLLYNWQKGDREIRMTASACSFLQRHGGALETLANYHWADFLESRNRLAPRIIQKVERDGPRRPSLAKYLQILMQDERGECFYCGKTFGTSVLPTVDHVIPRSFLLEDPLWDLVLACARCNNEKSDWLPEAIFLERLVNRNGSRLRAQMGGGASLIGAQDLPRLYEAAISLEWPRFWAP